MGSVLVLALVSILRSFGQLQASPCSSYSTINDPTRKATHRSVRYECDSNLVVKWYRFITPGSNMIPESCVYSMAANGYRCGTYGAGWLNGQHPTVAQGIVTRTACYMHADNCCYLSNTIRVQNCGSFYIYELQPAQCTSRYCTTANPNENECTSGNHNCHAVANCQDVSNGFKCTCKQGYTGNGVNCTDIDECTSGSHNCHPNSSCKNTDASFTCTCKVGYTGNGINCAVSKIVSCLADRFGIIVGKSISPFVNTSATLQDSSCTATSNTTHFIITTSFTECGSSMNESREFIIISNALIMSDGTSHVITRKWNNVVVPFSCQYRRSELEKSLESIKPNINPSIHARENGFGNFTLTISMAHSGSFDSFYSSYPVMAKVADRLFIQISLNANASNIVLIINQCFSTPSWNKDDATKYRLIHERCPTDNTLTFHSGDIHHKRISFLAFNFVKNVKAIYLHCEVYLCHKHSKHPRCTSGCGINKVPARKEREIQKREIEDADYTRTYVLDTGAIQKEDDATKCASFSNISTSTIVLGVGVGILALLLVGIFTVRMIKSNSIKFNNMKQPQVAVTKAAYDYKAIEMDQCT